MKKLAILSVLCLAALACGLSDLDVLLPPLPTVVMVSPMATLPYTVAPPPTYTATPTLIGLRPSPTPTDTPPPTGTFTNDTPVPVRTRIGPAISPTAIPGGTGFDMILLSTSTIYNGDCGKNTVTFDVQVTKPDKIQDVVIFVRLRNKLTSEETYWDRGNSMVSQGDGKFSYVLAAEDLGDHSNTWVVYQLVGTDDEQQVKARSPVYGENLTLLKCP
ncbi:MAG: hypothetical protein ACM3QS_09395 [Bacteroidota bacterium]